MSKHTKKAISEAFMDLLRHKSLDKITVKDIIESAEINRNTFYYHFQDIYDLLEKTFQDESEQFLNETLSDCTITEEYIRLVSVFQKNREAIVHIYNSKGRDVLIHYLESSTGTFVSRFVKQASAGMKLSQTGEEYITSFYSYAIIGSTMHWVEKGMPDYEDGLIRTVASSLEATISKMIETYIAEHAEECR